MCLLCRLWDCGWPRMLNASLIYWVWVWLCRGCSQRERPEYPERRRDKKKDLECDRVIKRHRTRGMKQRGGEDRVPTFPQYPQGLEMKLKGINGHPAWWYWKPLFSLKGRKSGWCLLFIQFLNSFQEAKKKKKLQTGKIQQQQQEGEKEPWMNPELTVKVHVADRIIVVLWLWFLLANTFFLSIPRNLFPQTHFIEP